MTQKQQLLEMFRRNDNRLTLGIIMGTSFCCEYRARISELRAGGYTIECVKGKTPSENIYILHEPDKNGQVVFA